MDIGFVSFVLDLASKIDKAFAWIKSWKFRQVFGNDVTKEFHIIYILYVSPDRSIRFLKPKQTVPGRRPFGGINLTTINSCATTRALGCLVHMFGENSRTPPVILTDSDTDTDMDLSFVSIGGVTNFKTLDLLDNSSNLFLDIEDKSIVAKTSRLPLVTFRSGNYDYGFIIKIHPAENTHRTWICCGGFGEWGTSGAAWFLSKHWKKIRTFAKSKEFVYITRTRGATDEETSVMHNFLNGEDIERLAKEINKDGASKGKDVETKIIITTTTTETKTTTPSTENGPITFTPRPPAE